MDRGRNHKGRRGLVMHLPSATTDNNFNSYHPLLAGL